YPAPLRRGVHRGGARHRGRHPGRDARGGRDRAAASAARHACCRARRVDAGMSGIAIKPDVVVVGGGPAGSTVAWRLARAGCRVELLDAASFPRVKLCAGWITPGVLHDLELVPAAYPHTIQPFRTVSVAVGDTEYETRWDHVASYGIVRAEFDTFLLRRAGAAGVRVREGVRVRGVRAERDGVEIATDDGSIAADFVVGAGG